MSIIIRKIFDDYNPNHPKEIEQNTVNIANELLKNGVSIDILQRSTGLSEIITIFVVDKLRFGNSNKFDCSQLDYLCLR